MTTSRLTLADIPELTRYVTVAQVAKKFGITKTSVYYMIYDQQAFKDVYRLGGNPLDANSDERPIILLTRSEVEAVHQAKEKAKDVVPVRRLVNEWNKRVKQWGRDKGWTQPISDKGQPNAELVREYIKANPNDLRPDTGVAAPTETEHTMTATPAETVTIDGTVYVVDRCEFEEMSTMTVLCTLTARNGGTTTIVSRDKIAHGAFVAMGSAKLQRTPSATLRAALEPLFGPFPTITPAN